MWRKVKKIYKENREYHISRIAVVNVKKQPGGKSTNNAELIAAFERDNKRFLLEEISLFGRIDYIVCCGDVVADCLSRCYDGCLQFKNGLAATTNGIKVIKFVHPQTRKSTEELFFKLYDIVKKLEKDKRKVLRYNISK